MLIKVVPKRKVLKKKEINNGNNYQSFAQESINIEYNGENPHKKKY